MDRDIAETMYKKNQCFCLCENRFCVILKNDSVFFLIATADVQKDIELQEAYLISHFVNKSQSKVFSRNVINQLDNVLSYDMETFKIARTTPYAVNLYLVPLGLGKHGI